MRPLTRFTTFLLLALMPHDQALIGDLTEERSSGRSGLWYLRQALIAILMNGFKGIFQHRGMAVRAAAGGWAVFLLFVAIKGNLLTTETGRSLIAGSSLLRVLSSSLIGFGAAGLVLARVARSRPAPALLAFTLTVLVVMASLAVGFASTYDGSAPFHEIWKVGFYAAFPGVASLWWSGFVVVPVTIWTAGVIARNGEMAKQRAS